MYEIRHYINSANRDYFMEWYARLRDVKARMAVDRRIMRMELGNFGDHKFIRDDVWELRIDTGPGYRVYYARAGSVIILLLCGGDKHTQNADIDRACQYFRDWKRANGKEDEL
jgi:putative addiction module killer protein